MCRSIVASIVIPLLISLQTRIAAETDIGTKDYCNMETVNATCQENQVILLTRANYGRMNLGRCVKGNYGFLGCSVDVMSYLDTICSGRHNCLYKVPDEVLYNSHPCPGDFTSYLEVAYQCVKVETGNRAHCHSHKVLRVSSSSGYLASTITEQHNLGSVHCPWVIEAQPGQRINISLLNFARTSDLVGKDVVNGYSPQRLDVCFELAVVSDAIDKKTVTICGGDARESVAYISKTNVAEVQIINRKMLKSIGTFLLKYEVIGCPDVKTPADTFTKRSGDTLMVKCNSTTEVWYLTCRGTRWVGDTGNCTSVVPLSDPQLWSLDDLFSTEEVFPYGILIVVAIGVALGVFFGGVLLALIVIYSKRRLKKRSSLYNDMKIPPGEHFHTISRVPPGHEWGHTDGQYTDEGIERDMSYRSPMAERHLSDPGPPQIGTLENTHAAMFIEQPDLGDVQPQHQQPPPPQQGLNTFCKRSHLYESPATFT